MKAPWMLAGVLLAAGLGCGAILEDIREDPGLGSMASEDAGIREDSHPTEDVEESLRPRESDGVLVERKSVFAFPFQPRYIQCDEAVALAKDAASRHGLETGLVVGVMRVESAFIVNAISQAMAVGLMQVLPSSGERIGCGELFDAAENVDCGARILAAFLRYYRGNLVLALSGYNAGHAMPDRAKRESRIPSNFQYVEDVLRARARWLRDGCNAFE